MSVLIETSGGEIVIDLYCSECPLTTKNFLKLCKIKFYNNCLFYNVQQNFIAQTGDPTGTGTGGTSVYGIMYGPQATSFEDEIRKNRKHNKVGLVSMSGNEGSRSQFFITLRGEDLEHLDGKHTIFGEIAEGFDTLEKINALYTDDTNRPFQDFRIKHTYVLDDPFDDPPQLEIPPSSPQFEYPPDEKVNRRIPYEEGIADAEEESRTAAELDESIRRKEAESRAIVLEMTGDIPDAEAKPPAEVLFVCKLNPVTTDADLELIFSKFGPIKECAIIRDFKTGDSLNYAFIEFETEDAVLEAYEKMNNVLIDDRRIKVDFSQSVAKLWNKYLLRPHKQKGNRDNKPAEKKRPLAAPPPSSYTARDPQHPQREPLANATRATIARPSDNKSEGAASQTRSRDNIRSPKKDNSISRSDSKRGRSRSRSRERGRDGRRSNDRNKHRYKDRSRS